MSKIFLLSTLILAAVTGKAQDLTLNDLGYFERQGVNVLVFSNSFNGGFNDEKNSAEDDQPEGGQGEWHHRGSPALR